MFAGETSEDIKIIYFEKTVKKKIYLVYVNHCLFGYRGKQRI